MSRDQPHLTIKEDKGTADEQGLWERIPGWQRHDMESDKARLWTLWTLWQKMKGNKKSEARFLDILCFVLFPMLNMLNLSAGLGKQQFRTGGSTLTYL